MVWFPVLIGTTDPNPQKTVLDFFASGLAPCLNSPGCEGKSLQFDGVAARIYNWKKREILIDLGFNWESGNNKSASGWVGQKGSWEKRDDVNEEWIMGYHTAENSVSFTVSEAISTYTTCCNSYPRNQVPTTNTILSQEWDHVCYEISFWILKIIRQIYTDLNLLWMGHLRRLWYFHRNLLYSVYVCAC